ncbi:DNA-binding CsgD family transcriptional regulator [Pontibacter aydingkolensis]|uniref:DUF3987 domain-containing protein n=1 Tax=Pontibacter aydingkolensis TaxID=1911536 RepID=A0ABS7CZ41_9BACT|nr:DUF3987 domain-containing protein [Pontibacter aydingkolensis]MBW7469133.1 DUF3987 domain-containing protein [Pontibacter aydingkolensis]
MMQIQNSATTAQAAAVDQTNTTQSNSTFPIHVLPEAIREYMVEHEKYNGWSIDHSGLASIMTASSAIGNTHQAGNRGFVVSPVLFGVAVGLSGTAKSATAKRPFKQIIEQQISIIGQHKESMKEYKLRLAHWKKDKSQPMPEAPVQEKKFIAGSMTVPALAQALTNSRRSMTLFHDEVADFIDGINKNTKDDYLKFFDGEVYTRDIKGEDVFVELPFVNIIGTTQPSRLDVFAKNKGIGSGFSYRFLFSYPEETTPMFVSGEVNQQVLDNYDALFSQLLNRLYLSIDMNGNPVPRILKLTKSAQSTYDAWRMNFVQQEDLDEVERGIRNKLHNYSLRFCLILQLLYWAAGEAGKDEIGERAVEGAIELTGYFLESALKAHEHMAIGTNNNATVITPRELDVVGLYNEGYTYADIKDLINMSMQKIKSTLHMNKSLLTSEARHRLKK